MKINGILVNRQDFELEYGKHGVTNPDLIDSIINKFEEKIPEFIDGIIRVGCR